MHKRAAAAAAAAWSVISVSIADAKDRNQPLLVKDREAALRVGGGAWPGSVGGQQVLQQRRRAPAKNKNSQKHNHLCVCVCVCVYVCVCVCPLMYACVFVRTHTRECV